MPKDEVISLLVQLILDEKINGGIDATGGYLQAGISQASLAHMMCSAAHRCFGVVCCVCVCVSVDVHGVVVEPHALQQVQAVGGDPPEDQQLTQLETHQHGRRTIER